MMWSEVDRRAKRTVPRQCLSDHGMHKDAEAMPIPRAPHKRMELLIDILIRCTNCCRKLD